MDRAGVVIVNNRIYRHKVIRINYTTYDMRRAQDSLNPRTQGNIMVLANEPDNGTDSGTTGTTAHPYWYARVIGIFHANVRRSAEVQHDRMEFLWVRWLRRDDTFRAGFSARRLHRVAFDDEREPGAFGFVNPADVIRGVHVIPAFAHGRREGVSTMSLTNPTLSTQWHNDIIVLVPTRV